MSQNAKDSLCFPTEGNGGAGLSLAAADPRVVKVMQTIEAGSPAGISELAQSVNLSASRLSHLFKQQTGVSLQTVLTRRRLEAALDLLRTTSMPVKEVSYHVGYRHASSFVRAFRNEFGASPTRYRAPLAS